MVADFEDVGVEIDSGGEEALFRREARIAGEEHAEILVLEDKGDGVVVDVVVAAADERQRRPDEAKLDAVVGAPRIACARIDDGQAIRACRCECILIRMPTTALPPSASSGTGGIIVPVGDAAYSWLPFRVSCQAMGNR